MSLKLLTFPALFRSQKVLVTAEMAGVKVDVDTNVTQEQLTKLSVHGKVPVLVTPEGNLSESNAMMRYVARKAGAGSTLYGRTPFEAALVDAWVDFCLNEVEVPATLWIAPILGWMDNNPAVTDRAQKDLVKALGVLEGHLLAETFLVGRQITLADIALVTTLLLPMKLVLDEAARRPFPNVVRWFTTCVNQQAFVDVVGTVALCEVALKAAAAAAKPAKEAAKPAKEAAKPAKEAAKPKEEPKPAKAAESAKPAKRTQEDREEEDEAPKEQQSKATAALDALPRSPFILDAWKRTYSNAPGGDCYKVMPEFWEKLDKPGWSLWFVKYMFDEENTVLFRTSNLCGGFMQKSEEMRKYGFGTLQICGTQSAQKIRGAFLIRGDSNKPWIETNEMAESFEWTRVDPESEADRKKLEQLWCDGDNIDIDGEKTPILDCKVFK